MPKLIRRTALLAKVETTSGTDALPTGAANAMMIRNLQVTPIEQEVEDRALIRAYLGNSDRVIVAGWGKFEFEVELAGSGAAGTAPGFDALLQGSGFGAPTIVASTSAAYAPISTGFKTLTLVANIDGVQHKLLYAAGSMAMGLDARKVPFMRFSFTGLYVAVADVAFPTAVYTAFVKPLAVNKANTTFTLHGYAAVMESLQIDLKNEVTYRNLVNFEGVSINDRKPDGSISMELASMASKNWFTSIAAGTTGALQMVHGVTAGNIVQIDAPAAQLFSPRYSDSQGAAMLQANLVFAPGSSGNDELTLTFK